VSHCLDHTVETIRGNIAKPLGCVGQSQVWDIIFRTALILYHPRRSCTISDLAHLSSTGGRGPVEIAISDRGTVLLAYVTVQTGLRYNTASDTLYSHSASWACVVFAFPAIFTLAHDLKVELYCDAMPSFLLPNIA